MIKPHKIARQHPSGKGGRTVAVLGSGVEVKKSTIEGAENGLFVTRQFAKDELITEYDGHLYSKSEVSRKSALWLHVTNLAPGPDTLLCSPVKPRKGQGGAGYINDPSLRMTEEGTFAYDPEGRKRVNCRFFYDRDNNRVFAQASQEIKKGQEVFVFYAWPRLEAEIQRPCGCVKRGHKEQGGKG